MKILLDELMNKKNLTIRQVSILTGVPKSTVSDIVSRGRIPRLDTMEQLAKSASPTCLNQIINKCPRTRTNFKNVSVSIK